MKLSHLTIAISVALGLAACGGSSNNVDNSTTTTGGGSGGAGGTGGSGGTTTTTPPPPEDGPDIVKEAGREAPGFKPQERFVPEIKSAKAVYSGRNDRQPIGGYQDYNTSYDTGAPKYNAYSDKKPAPDLLPNGVADFVETHYVSGVTKVPDALRTGAIYNYVDKGHLVGTGLFNQGEGIASNNPGAVIADPGFTYAQGKDKRYYRMKPVGAAWNAVSSGTDYEPVNPAFKSQFTGGTVGQDALVFIPNARLSTHQLASEVAVATNNQFNDTKRYNYKSTGLPSIDNNDVRGGIDGISMGGDNDTYTFLLAVYDEDANRTGILEAKKFSALSGYQIDRRGEQSDNTYFGIKTIKDKNTGNTLFVTLPSVNTVTASGITLNADEVAAIAGMQKGNTTISTNFIKRVEVVKYTDADLAAADTAGKPLKAYDTAGAEQEIGVRGGVGQPPQVTGGVIEFKQYYDSQGNLIYRQALDPAQLVASDEILAVGDETSGSIDFVAVSPVAAEVSGSATLLSDGVTQVTAKVTTDIIDEVIDKYQPVMTGNGFDINRSVVEWNYLTLLGKQYDLASNVTSKANELDFSSLKVANEIQDVPLTATYTVAGNKGTTSAGDDKDEQFTVDAGMLKVYNLPYHRSFVNINQDAVDNTGNRGFYDSFELSNNGIGNGRYGALQVAGYETPTIPWNGRAKYNGKSYGIYTDGQYVSGDIILNADFGKDRPGVSGSVHNRVLADGKSAPDMELQRIQLLVNSQGTNNFDTGTAAMSASNKTASGKVLIGGVQNAGTWDFQLYGPDAEEIGGLIQYGNDAPVTGQKQPMGAFNKGSNGKSQGYNEVFSAQRVGFSETSNQSQIPVK